jgi:hypothetical protein
MLRPFNGEYRTYRSPKGRRSPTMTTASRMVYTPGNISYTFGYTLATFREQ